MERKKGPFTVRETAVLIGRRLDETYKLLESGRLKGRKLVGRWLVSVASIEAFKRAAKRRRSAAHHVSAPIRAKAGAVHDEHSRQAESVAALG